MLQQQKTIVDANKLDRLVSLSWTLLRHLRLNLSRMCFTFACPQWTTDTEFHSWRSSPLLHMKLRIFSLGDPHPWCASSSEFSLGDRSSPLFANEVQNFLSWRYIFTTGTRNLCGFFCILCLKKKPQENLKNICVFFFLNGWLESVWSIVDSFCNLCLNQGPQESQECFLGFFFWSKKLSTCRFRRAATS